MQRNLLTASVTLLLLLLSAQSVSAQVTNSFTEQTKLIRIKKIATEWQGSKLTLHTRDGQQFKGRLEKVSGGFYHLSSGHDSIEVPLADVVRVSFEPGAPEILLSLASAIMGGGFLSGAILIASEDASSADVTLAALLGLLGGGLWGYSTFYETEIIELE